jgi:1,2-diacylglycerol 3-alpha-glucosyltransferase
VHTRTQQPLNIGIVTTWFERGAAYVSKAYLETLSVKHNMFIYARGGERYAKDNPDWDRDFVTWGKRCRFGVPQFIVWSDFREWVLGNNLDIVIFNEQQSWDVVLRSLELEILIGAYVDYYTPKTVPFFWLYDFLLCNTQRHYSVFKDHPQVFYIPWGTNCSLFSGNPGRTNENSVAFFHSSGRNCYRKGTDLLVEAFQNLHGNARLIIHSERLSEYPEIVAAINQDPRIEAIEETVGGSGLYNLGDVYVYPSRLDGIGLTIAEAMSSGLPVITTDNPPMNEFVKHGQNGRLVPVQSFERRSDDYYWDESICSVVGLADAMQFYVDNMRNLRGYKLNAREFALENLDWSKNSADLPDIVGGLTQIAKPKRLVSETAKYEYSRYPYLIMSAARRKTQRLLNNLFIS